MWVVYKYVLFFGINGVFCGVDFLFRMCWLYLYCLLLFWGVILFFGDFVNVLFVLELMDFYVFCDFLIFIILLFLDGEDGLFKDIVGDKVMSFR